MNLCENCGLTEELHDKNRRCPGPAHRFFTEKKPPFPGAELFQVTATFGNFSSREDAESFRKWLQTSVYTKEPLIDTEIKGSWH